MKRQKLKSLAFEAAMMFCLILFTASISYPQTVVSRARIGGYAEDVTFISSGALKDNIAMIDGYELYTASIAKKDKGKQPLIKLCEFKTPEIDVNATGFTYIESEGLFVMNQRSSPKKLFLFDQTCAFKGTRPIQYLNPAYRPGHMEGLAYIPSNSPAYPDHLIMVVWDDASLGPVRLEIVRRDGLVVSEINKPDWPEVFNAGLGDVTYLAPNRLLVSVYDNGLWTMDFNGNILSGPLMPAGVNGLGEGIAHLNDGRIVATNWPQSLLFFDSNLNRQPESDRNDIIGLNLNTANGIGWNSDTNQFLITHDSQSSTTTPRITAVSTALDSATPVVDLSSFPFTRQTTYLPAESLTAALRFASAADRAILLFNSNGTLNSQISLSTASLGQNLGPPQALAYIPTTNEFVVAFNGINDPGLAAERRRLRVFSRTGTLVRTLDLTATGIQGLAGLDYFEDPGGGGRLMILSSAGRVITTDLDGNSRNAAGFLIGEFNSRVKLGMISRNDITAITTGPLAGAFAVVDSSGGEIVIFRMD